MEDNVDPAVLDLYTLLHETEAIERGYALGTIERKLYVVHYRKFFSKFRMFSQRTSMSFEQFYESYSVNCPRAKHVFLVDRQKVTPPSQDAFHHCLFNALEAVQLQMETAPTYLTKLQHSLAGTSHKEALQTVVRWMEQDSFKEEDQRRKICDGLKQMYMDVVLKPADQTTTC